MATLHKSTPKFVYAPTECFDPRLDFVLSRLFPREWNLLKYEKPLVNTKGREMEILPVTEHFNLNQNEINLKKEMLSFSVKVTKVRIVKLGSRPRWKQL